MTGPGAPVVQGAVRSGPIGLFRCPDCGTLPGAGLGEDRNMRPTDERLAP